jgi:pimeloyl-ACP methyl ester carboxylesterase
MCHGIASHKQEYLDLYPRLAEIIGQEGIGSIRFDFRGHGESSGTSLDFSVTTQLIDIDTIINWLNNQADLANLPLSFVGVSFGSAPGIFYQKLHSVFKEISLFAPVLSYRATFVEPTTSWGQRNFSANAWGEAKGKGFLLLDGEFKMSLQLLYELMLLDPLSIIGSINVPIQIFHGTDDTVVPCSVAETISKSYSQIDVRVIPNMGHGLYVTGDDDGITEPSRFIQEDYFQSTLRFISKLNH